MNGENEDLRYSIEKIMEGIDNPKQGLPLPVFEMITQLTPMVNVDLLIRDLEGRILLSWRDDCGSGWHIPGGIIRYKESREMRILKTAEQELGMQVSFDKEPLAINEIMIPYAMRGHFISFLYRCHLLEENKWPIFNTDCNSHHHNGELAWHEKCPDNLIEGQKVYQAYFRQRNTSLLNYENLEKIKKGKMTFCVDIDGVIAQFNEQLQYDATAPNLPVIQIVNRLYELGNEIILFTARGYKTGIDWSEITRQQMKKWGVHYTQLKFGKPAADFYIDDHNMDLNTLYQLNF